MYKYDLSVIVPVYNVEKYLKEAVSSLLNAKSDMEIILVDDGSTDNSGKICDEYSNHSNIKVVHKENAGLPSARKAGLKQAEGAYIGFLDGDDYVSEDYYERMIIAAKESNADVVASQFTYEYGSLAGSGSSAEEIPSSQIVKSVVPSGLYVGEELMALREKAVYCEPYYSNGVLPSLCMKIIKHEYMDRYLATVPDYLTLGEDASCSYPVMYSCNSIYVLGDNTGYHYRQHRESMSLKADSRKIEKILTYLTYFHEKMAPYYEQYKYQINMFYSWQIRDAIRNESFVDETLGEKRRKLSELRNNPIVSNCMVEIHSLPFKYDIILKLFKYRCYGLLVAFYKLLKNG